MTANKILERAQNYAHVALSTAKSYGGCAYTCVSKHNLGPELVGTLATASLAFSAWTRGIYDVRYAREGAVRYVGGEETYVGRQVHDLNVWKLGALCAKAGAAIYTASDFATEFAPCFTQCLGEVHSDAAKQH